MLVGFGQANVKAEGSAVGFDTASESFTARYTHDTIALAFALTEEAVEDNLYESLSARYTKALARSMAYTKQVRGANVLNNAFSVTGGDGVTLANTAHPTALGGTFSNRSATDADLTDVSLEKSMIDITGFIDERGLKISMKGEKLIIPVNIQFVDDRILESTLRVGTADNDINAIKNMGMIPGGFTINPSLTDQNSESIKNK